MLFYIDFTDGPIPLKYLSNTYTNLDRQCGTVVKYLPDSQKDVGSNPTIGRKTKLDIWKPSEEEVPLLSNRISKENQ